MPPSTYHIENAKSGRSNCKKCKTNISKGDLRIVTSAYSETRDMDFISNYHTTCFQVPPRAMKGMSAEDFVEEHLEDKTADEILDDEDQKAEIIAAINVKPEKKKKAAKKKGKKRSAKELAAAEEEGQENNTKIKAEMNEMFDDEENEEDTKPAAAAALGVQEWVGCEKCSKWRKLPFNILPDDLPEGDWFCTMNTWDTFNTCEVEEEPQPEEEAEC